MATNEELTQLYQALRERCVAIGRTVTPEQAAAMTPCCPEWSVKDLIAHLAGVPVDVLEGNLENAATAEWADAQVARRANDSLTTILDEWEATAEHFDPLLTGIAADIDPRFFFDCWTHEWDLRQALGLAAAPDMTLPMFLLPQLVAMLTEAGASKGHDPVTLVVGTPEGPQRHLLGGDDEAGNESAAGEANGEATPELQVSLFELARLAVGRRSIAQMQALGPAANPDQLVYFTASPIDIVDPVTK